MQLLSVNIGAKETQVNGMELETTGIYKVPASGPIRIGPEGIQHDFIGDQKNHGGPDQAIYIYGTTDYDWWAQELGRAPAPGTFGENLTVSGLESAPFNVGDRLRIGGAVLEVTAPRTPCSTLASRMRDPEFVKKYRKAERPGLYCRVIEGGVVDAGNEVVLAPRAGESVSMLEMFRNQYRRDKDEATLRRLLRAPISVRARASLERELQKFVSDHSA